MKSDRPKSGPWSGNRFWRLAGFLFFLQGGLILLFAERVQKVPLPAADAVHFRLLGKPLTAAQLAQTFFAADPTVFPLPGLEGFSDRAWLHRVSSGNPPLGAAEAPALLKLNTARLGTYFPPYSGAQETVFAKSLDQQEPGVDAWPVFLAPVTERAESGFVIEGALAARQLNPPVALRSWSSSQLLSNSIVQIAVDGAGQVIAARLSGRSGLADADSEAVRQSLRLRFKPDTGGAAAWGRAVFEWQTVEKPGAGGAGLP